MAGTDEQLEFLKSIVSRLESAGIPYMLTGSMATAVYAAPRMTRDIDLVIECKLEDAARIAELFRADCYVDEGTIRDAVMRQSMFNVIHRSWIIKADFIIRKDEEYRREEFRRRRAFDVEGTTVFVTAPEDLILSKLIWARGSEHLGCRHRSRPGLSEELVGSAWTGGHVGRGSPRMSHVEESAEARFRHMLMHLPPGRRVVMACRMFSTAMALARAGLRQQGRVDESEMRQRLFLRLHGRDFAAAERSRILESLRAIESPPRTC